MAKAKIEKLVMIYDAGDWQLYYHPCEYHYDDTPKTEFG